MSNVVDDAILWQNKEGHEINKTKMQITCSKSWCHKHAIQMDKQHMITKKLLLVATTLTEPIIGILDEGATPKILTYVITDPKILEGSRRQPP